MEIGSLAEWAGAAASAVAIILAMKANRIASQANESVQKSENERMLYQQQQDAKLAQAEEERRRIDSQQLEATQRKERRELAGVLQAWWVKPRDFPKRKYGFILQNEGAHSGVFRDVVVKHSSKHGYGVMEIEVVPPGTYFQQNAQTLLEPVEHLFGYDPVAHSEKFEIIEVAYTDSLGDRWIWTPEGLREAPK